MHVINEDPTLDSDLDTFRRDLQAASEVVVGLHERIDQLRVVPGRTRQEIVSLLDEPLPETPQPLADILRQFEDAILANLAFSQSPRFFGYINGCGNQAAVIAELLAAAANQICAKWEFAPAASEVERLVVRWLAEFVGYPTSSGGCLLSGGSAGNLVGLAVARQRRAPYDVANAGLRGGPPLGVYVSEEGHASIDKSMAMLGMGRAHLRRISTTPDLTIDMDALARQVAADRAQGWHPLCVVGTAGTTNCGAVDPLESLAQFAKAHDLWFHVDAAYGGPAAATAAAGALFKGLDRADSVVVNPHKWLFVPVEAACILVRDPEALRATFGVVADYLRPEDGAAWDSPRDFKDVGPQLSRSFRALKVWMTFKAYGAARLRHAIDHNIAVMGYLADRIAASDDFIRVGPAPLSVVCFQYRGEDRSMHTDVRYLNALNGQLLEAMLNDGRVFISGTIIRGRRVLRACSVNHRVRRGDADTLLRVLREMGQSLDPRVTV